ncbi:uncharacterized protein BX663DRAFT_509769 [Cokeromyces recurvatus]|uniref:uncharacterized protein n=1 Tax=Cokeromyces recurvatus TaxID=90255 RepID=UPI00221E55B2|nr:uncharacterized protein BX663DRAFT_509769 [Cokeromyces recurvatus]KAI7902591.1 hypothetical protein BX663DRAFT_509769 [Cokeromyces recurvatus]
MQIRVLGVPQTGAKSRVETQIKLCIQLVTDDGDKAQWWSHLKLPEHMVAKDKLKRQILDDKSVIINPEKMLFLTARVICASDPSRKVMTCVGCIQRERKRSQRRKENKVNIQENTALEEQKILLFNCSEMVDFSSGDTILPTRITCYCRHHNERLGFCIYFEMHDHTGKRVATGMSPPIMITDDHKSNKVKPGRKRLRTTIANSNKSPNVENRPALAPNYFSSQPYHIQPRPPTLQSPMDSPISAFSEKLIMPQPPPLEQRPLLQRLIPSEGPTFGGVEVTLLGSGFRTGLTCMFGDVAASSTHYWSPNTLVCILPPAAEAGTVVVSFKEYPLVVESQDVMLFTYYNENDRALMELALQVVGLKMTGKVEDAREIAMRIVQGGNNNNNNNNNNQQQQQHQQNNNLALEQHIIQVLEIMKTFNDVDSSDVSLANPQQHTMLHFAAMLGFPRLTETLIELGCDVNAVDKNGYTALHYAVWYGHEAVVRSLITKGHADPDIINLWNKRPFELTKSDAIRAILLEETPSEAEDYLSSDAQSADIDTSFDEDDDSSVWLSDCKESLPSQMWSSFVSYTSTDDDDDEEEEEKNVSPTSIQYLSTEENKVHSADEIMDAEPIHTIPDTSDDDEQPLTKEMSWMQRTLSHFQQPSNDTTSFLQNIKNNMPTKTTDLKNLADLLQFPSPTTMLANMFSQSQNNKPEEQLAWYMALAYAMGARSFIEQQQEATDEEPPTSNQQPTIQIAKKRRDKRLFSFWVPMLCLMVIWLIFQFVSSHPGIIDTIIGISGFRRQYLTIH